MSENLLRNLHAYNVCWLSDILTYRAFMNAGDVQITASKCQSCHHGRRLLPHVQDYKVPEPLHAVDGQRLRTCPLRVLR